jgi:hypothetical protein
MVAILAQSRQDARKEPVANLPLHGAKNNIMRRLSILILAGLVLGCGTGEYNARLAATLQGAGRKAQFDKFLYAEGQDVQVNDAGGQATGVKLRIPSTLDANSKTLPNTDPKAQPPFVKLPGLGYAYERQLDDPAGKFAPVYLYLCAVPKADQNADALMADIQKGAAAVGQGAWQDLQADSPSGTKVPLKLLSVTGQQDFDPGTGPTKLEGRFDCYFYDAPQHFVFIAFRAPTAQATKYLYFDAARASVGTLQAAGAPAGAPAPAPAPAAGA